MGGTCFDFISYSLGPVELNSQAVQVPDCPRDLPLFDPAKLLFRDDAKIIYLCDDLI